MADLHLDVALSDYDHVRDFTAGRVRAAGIAITHVDLPVEEIFSRFTRFRPWHVSEMSLARCVALQSQDAAGFVVLPVFPSRFFRQHAIYVAADSPLERPGQLAGRRVGIPEWVQTALVWLRAWLVHQCGVALADVAWFQAGVNVAGHVDEVAPRLPRGLHYTPVAGRSLTELLLAGEIDAILSARPPRLFEQGDPRIRRLLGDWRGAEEAYWEATGIFPIMHAVVLRRDVHEAHPWVGASLLGALETAKRRSLARLRDANICRFPLPWGFARAEEAAARFGEDFWPYGLAANRATLEAFLAYAHEQGVAHRPVTLDELFPEQVRESFEV